MAINQGIRRVAADEGQRNLNWKSRPAFSHFPQKAITAHDFVSRKSGRWMRKTGREAVKSSKKCPFLDLLQITVDICMELTFKLTGADRCTYSSDIRGFQKIFNGSINMNTVKNKEKVGCVDKFLNFFRTNWVKIWKFFWNLRSDYIRHLILVSSLFFRRMCKKSKELCNRINVQKLRNKRFKL